MGVTRLGYTERQIEQMYFGKWSDLFEVYKAVYNFETENRLFPSNVPVQEEPRGSLKDL